MKHYQYQLVLFVKRIGTLMWSKTQQNLGSAINVETYGRHELSGG